jgi:hypothetical protein
VPPATIDFSQISNERASVFPHRTCRVSSAVVCRARAANGARNDTELVLREGTNEPIRDVQIPIGLGGAVIVVSEKTAEVKLTMIAGAAVSWRATRVDGKPSPQIS